MYELKSNLEDYYYESQLALNKSVLKNYKTSHSDRTVYLEDGDEFQIELHNIHDCTIGAKIKINGEYLGNTIVLRPGERVWLERFLDSNRKLKFSTYKVDNDEASKKAIEKNGNIEIEFFREKKRRTSNYWNHSATIWDNNMYLGNQNLLSTSITSDCIPRCTCLSSNLMNCEIETGRVEKGSYSNQEFETVDVDFEYYSYKTESFKILPKSMKPVYANDLEKIYCSECGRKLKPKYKFCPYCGNSIE